MLQFLFIEVPVYWNVNPSLVFQLPAASDSYEASIFARLKICTIIFCFMRLVSASIWGKLTKIFLVSSQTKTAQPKRKCAVTAKSCPASSFMFFDVQDKEHVVLAAFLQHVASTTQPLIFHLFIRMRDHCPSCLFLKRKIASLSFVLPQLALRSDEGNCVHVYPETGGTHSKLTTVASTKVIIYARSGQAKPEQNSPGLFSGQELRPQSYCLKKKKKSRPVQFRADTVSSHS